MVSDEELAHWRTWIGRSYQARGLISPELVRRFQATLDHEARAPEPGETAPLGIHWTIAPPVMRDSELGPDGHPARGGFIPPVRLPQRMWAGGKLRIHDPLKVGDRVDRVTRVAAVEVKHGSTGDLCFVTLVHEFMTARGVAIEERRDIVYREAGPSRVVPPSEKHQLPHAAQEPFASNTTMLFRYSALTFNGHRIHYDRDYARDVEGYSDLVVHGPLQATVLMDLAERTLGKPLQQFNFRGVSPLFVGQAATLNAVGDARGLALWVETADGRRTMAATAEG